MELRAAYSLFACEASRNLIEAHKLRPGLTAEGTVLCVSWKLQNLRLEGVVGSALAPPTVTEIIDLESAILTAVLGKSPDPRWSGRLCAKAFTEKPRAASGMMAAIVHLDLDMMSGIQEINDQTNDSSLATFQAPLDQCVKGNPVKQ